MNKKAISLVTAILICILILVCVGLIASVIMRNLNPEDSIAKSEKFCTDNGGNWSNNQCCIRFNSVNKTVDKYNSSCYNLEFINGTYFFTRDG